MQENWGRRKEGGLLLVGCALKREGDEQRDGLVTVAIDMTCCAALAGAPLHLCLRSGEEAREQVEGRKKGGEESWGRSQRSGTRGSCLQVS